jgi:hypothetical protein
MTIHISKSARHISKAVRSHARQMGTATLMVY